MPQIAVVLPVTYNCAVVFDGYLERDREVVGIVQYDVAPKENLMRRSAIVESLRLNASDHWKPADRREINGKQDGQHKPIDTNGFFLD